MTTDRGGSGGAAAGQARADRASATRATSGGPNPGRGNGGQGQAHQESGAAPSHVEPGTGWPGDPATPQTPVARSAADVRQLAATAGTVDELAARESVCRACPRLVSWREQVATVKRRSFASERYWGRPVPDWGAADAAVAVVGLAPAAHGGNRTGRIFTGDRSGDVLFASLYRCGFAAQPESVTAGDGQRLIGMRVLAAVHCAPPDNKPTPAERDTCAPWLEAELTLLQPTLRVLVCLGGFAWQAVWPPLAAAGIGLPKPRPSFGHGTEVALDLPPGSRPGRLWLIGCYHPSQQNTFTGRVTPDMLDTVFNRARELAVR
jgi:uracil-DNA glycosylase